MNGQNSTLTTTVEKKQMWAIVSLDYPQLTPICRMEDVTDEMRQWDAIVKRIRLILKDPLKFEMLSPGLWQIEITSNMVLFLELTAELRRTPYKHQVLLLSTTPDWIEIKPLPEASIMQS